MVLPPKAREASAEALADKVWQTLQHAWDKVESLCVEKNELYFLCEGKLVPGLCQPSHKYGHFEMATADRSIGSGAVKLKHSNFATTKNGV